MLSCRASLNEVMRHGIRKRARCIEQLHEVRVGMAGGRRVGRSDYFGTHGISSRYGDDATHLSMTTHAEDLLYSD